MPDYIPDLMPDHIPHYLPDLHSRLHSSIYSRLNSRLHIRLHSRLHTRLDFRSHAMIASDLKRQIITLIQNARLWRQFKPPNYKANSKRQIIKLSYFKGWGSLEVKVNFKWAKLTFLDLLRRALPEVCCHVVACDSRHVLAMVLVQTMKTVIVQ